MVSTSRVLNEASTVAALCLLLYAFVAWYLSGAVANGGGGDLRAIAIAPATLYSTNDFIIMACASLLCYTAARFAMFLVSRVAQHSLVAFPLLIWGVGALVGRWLGWPHVIGDELPPEIYALISWAVEKPSLWVKQEVLFYFVVISAGMTMLAIAQRVINKCRE